MKSRFFNDEQAILTRSSRKKQQPIAFEEVDMNECCCAIEGNGLKTYGVSTCIALAVRGYFFEEENKRVAFCALYHWSGFSAKSRFTPIASTQEVFENLYYTCLDELDLEEEDMLYLSELSLIGGERRQVDNNGELIVSGTEAEVNSLITVWDKRADFNFWFDCSNAQFNARNFLTESEMSINVEVTPQNIRYWVLNDSESQNQAQLYHGM